MRMAGASAERRVAFAAMGSAGGRCRWDEWPWTGPDTWLNLTARPPGR